MKKLTLGSIAAGLILAAGTIAALKDIGGFIPYAHADDVKVIADDVEALQENDKNQDEAIKNGITKSQAQFSILRLERKQDRLERKDELTSFEQETLEEITEEIENLEEQLTE